MRQDPVCEMFNAISPTYDKVNRLVSFGIDQGWRARLKQELPLSEDLQLLDIATGTGDQLIKLMQSCSNITSALGIDVAEEMLLRGREKLLHEGLEKRATLICASALELPLKEESVDCTTISFGIRNVGDPLAALKEMHRVLKTHGRALILEFSLPRNRVVRMGYLFYLRHILPRVAGWISGNKAAYVYLNRTIEQFPCGEAFCSLMRQAGFNKVRAIPLTFGVATLYVGEK